MLRILEKHAVGGAFDADEARILTRAFDDAWKAVCDSGAPFASPEHAAATRELLALRIIEMAQFGERDPNRLRADALLYLARTNMKSTGLQLVALGSTTPGWSTTSPGTGATGARDRSNGGRR